MLQLFNYIRCMRLPYQITPQIFSGNLRYMSDKTKKPPCKKTQPTSPSCKDKSKADAKKEECKKKKEPAAKTECKKKEKPEVKKTECKSKQPDEAKKTECKKHEPKAEKKNESALAGGTKCNVKNKKDPCPPASDKKKEKQKSCEELFLKRSKSPCKPCPPKPNYEESKKWARITLMGVLPVVAILTILVFTTHKEGERPPFKHYPHMYNRTKPFFFGDGNHSRFHNSHWNALPPDGYEDEIDPEAVGKKPETDSEREERLKEFAGVLKDWKKVNDKREAEAKKAGANAEKEAKKQQELEEKEEKKRQAEAEKAEKKRQAEAEKEAKKLQAQAEKEEKKLRVEFEKLRKQEEAEEKKREKEAQNLGSFFFFRTTTED